MSDFDTQDINQIRASLKPRGLAIYDYGKGLHSYPYDAPWLTDEKFGEVYDNVKSNTLVDRVRCYSHYLFMEQIQKIDGDILEVGVWRGGTAGIFTQLCPDKTVYLADTFTGVVKSSEWEHYVDKAHDDTSENLVIDYLNGLGAKNFEILKGIFPEDTGPSIIDKKFAYVHIDVDVYLSAKDTFNYIWDCVVSGGIVVFDDFGFISACEGVNRFVNEIKNDPDKIFIQNLNGHGYIIKK